MANYANLLATIAANIYANHNNEVSADMVKAACNAMVTSLGVGYQFMGTAIPTTDPGTPDQKVCYLAVQPGTYTHFGGIEVDGEAIYFFRYITAWSYNRLPISMMRSALPSGDLDAVTQTGTWLLDSANTYTNAPRNATVGFLRVSQVLPGNWVLQEFFSFSGDLFFARRIDISSSPYQVGAWQELGGRETMMMKGVLPSSDLNSVTSTGTWILDSANTYTNSPNAATSGFLRVSEVETARWVLQEFYAFSGGILYKRRGRLSNHTWEAWQLVAGGGGSVTNNYTFNSYPSTVTVNATPSITTDTNQYLASTNSTADRTADILTLLQTTGVCHLGPGVFYVDGLVMPDDTTLTGCGPATQVYLASGANKFCVSMGKRDAVRDISFFGATNDVTISASVGTRHGILWAGNYTQTSSNNQQPQMGLVTGCRFRRFSGGGITCTDTGTGAMCHLEVSDCYMENCDAGINIAYWSEFHKFTSIRTYACYYGCINNGGNNTFVNCDFSSCKEGFLMDNLYSQSPNNSHGTCVGCVFNHTNSNTGVGIRILNCDNGFIFTACQIFFSQIVIEDSEGVVVSNTNFGKNNCSITISGGGTILFANNMHQDTPPAITVNNNQNVHFVNCYNRSTGAVISN